MAQLLDNAGHPMTWDELNRRNRAWHALFNEAKALGWSNERCAAYANGDYVGALVKR